MMFVNSGTQGEPPCGSLLCTKKKNRYSINCLKISSEYNILCLLTEKNKGDFHYEAEEEKHVSD